MFHWSASTSGPRLRGRPLPLEPPWRQGPLLNDSALERRRIFVWFFRSRSVDEKQSRNSILTEWIGMGRSGPQITAKRQLLDCVTLTMVLLSLLFRPGKCRVLFQSVPLHSAACGAATLWREKWSFSKCCASKANLFGQRRKFLRLPGELVMFFFPF